MCSQLRAQELRDLNVMGTTAENKYLLRGSRFESTFFPVKKCRFKPRASKKICIIYIVYIYIYIYIFNLKVYQELLLDKRFVGFVSTLPYTFSDSDEGDIHWTFSILSQLSCHYVLCSLEANVDMNYLKISAKNYTF